MSHPFTVRLIRVLPRLLTAWLVLAVIVEIASLGPRARGEAAGGQSLALFRDLAGGDLPAALGSGRWSGAVAGATAASLAVATLAVLVSLAFGPVLGVLAVRLKRWRIVDLLALPLSLLAWMPAFWLAALAVWWQIEHWAQPGYADAPPAQGGPTGLEPLWRIAQIAALTAPAAIGWQIRHVAESLSRAAAAPHVAAARARGLSGAALFYPHILRNASPALIDCLHRGLPTLLGTQVIVEWACRYPGLGRLAIESGRAGSLAGLLAAGLVFSTLVILIRGLTGHTR